MTLSRSKIASYYHSIMQCLLLYHAGFLSHIYIAVFDKLFVVLNILSMFLSQSPDFHYSAIVELKESSGSINYLNSGNRKSIAKELTNVILTETQEILLKVPQSSDYHILEMYICHII